MRVASRYGWIRDIPDHRDRIVHGRTLTAAPLPASVDLRPQCPPIYDQGDLGSCTANAIAAAVDFDRSKQSLPLIGPSRLFIYFNERVLESTVREDAGAQIRDGIKTVAAQGACAETDWPYADENLFREPDAVCYAKAKRDLVSQYSSLVQDEASLKSCLAAGFPFVFGMTVYDSFEGDAVAKSGIVPMPGQNEAAIGGHALLAVGYDDATDHFLVRNSWGTGWGLAGYCWIPYGYLTSPNLASDFWAINAVAATPDPAPATPKKGHFWSALGTAIGEALFGGNR